MGVGAGVPASFVEPGWWDWVRHSVKRWGWSLILSSWSWLLTQRQVYPASWGHERTESKGRSSPVRDGCIWTLGKLLFFFFLSSYSGRRSHSRKWKRRSRRRFPVFTLTWMRRHKADLICPRVFTLSCILLPEAIQTLLSNAQRIDSRRCLILTSA